MAGHLISTARLDEALRSPDVRIVDASWYMPADQKSGRAEFETAHIPGAVFLDIDQVSDPSSGLPHMLPDPAAFAVAAGALGLRREATVVVYDQLGIFSAPRVWWMLRAMGFPEVFVLDGGLPKWIGERRAVENGPSAPRPVTLEPRFDPAMVADLDGVRRLLETGAAQVVDARPADRFRGDAPEPRPGLRAGHMPGALNIPWNRLVDRSGVLKAEAELRDIFIDAGVDLDRPIVSSCGSGVTAAVLALGLARIGRQDVAIYDGSWAEWGGRDDTPVVTGP